MLNTTNKNYKRYILFILFFLFLAVYIFFIIRICSIKKIKTDLTTKNLSFNSDNHSYTSDFIDIPNGIYDIEINYSSTNDIKVEVSTDFYCRRFLLSDNPTLSCNDNNCSFSIWASNVCERIQLILSSENDDYTIDSITVSTSPKSKLFLLSKCSIIFAVLAIIIILINNKRIIKKHYKHILTISIITIFASLGLFNSYLVSGHDMVFHLLRIEGLSEAISYSSFPDKVQTNWCHGWGYAVSAMYCDLLLLPASILRVLGFPLMSCYKYYIFLVNLGTAFTSYYTFRKISNDNKISSLISFMYTCAPYRLCCIYTRSAVGEYTSTLFFPLILLALYYVYSNIDSPQYGKNLLIPSLGFALLLQTHILSCIMSSIFLVLFFLMRYKESFKKKRLIYISKIGICSLLMSLWFLIPFIRFSKEPLKIYAEKSWNDEIQWYGASLSELFAQIASPSTSFNFAYNTSLKERMPIPIGNGFIIICILFLYYHDKSKEKKRAIIQYLLLSFLAIFMSSIYFPYNYIHKFIPRIAGFIATVQFPYRYISISIVILSIASLFILSNLKNNVSQHIYYLVIAAAFIITLHQAFSVMYNSVYSGSFSTFYDSISIDSNFLEGEEYLYEGTDKSVSERDHEITGNNSNVISYSNNANNYHIQVEALGNDSYIEIPLYYYPGYIAKDLSNRKYEITRGNNNRIRVILPEAFNGELNVSYKGFFSWKIAEMISLLSFLALCVFSYIRKKNYSAIIT